jgi:hypothetical protein
MTRQSRMSAFVFVVLAISGVASAGGSLEESRWKDSHEKTLKGGVDEANKKCAASIAPRFDWSTIKFDDWQKLFGAIGGPTREYLAPSMALQQVCMKEDAKAAVQKQVKTIVIKAGDAIDVSLKDGELDFVISLKDKAHFPTRSAVVKYLETHL